MHRPHDASDAKKRFLDDIGKGSLAARKKDFGMFQKTEHWFGRQRQAHDKYKPLVTPAFAQCRDALPHWNVFGPDGEPIGTVTSVS